MPRNLVIDLEQDGVLTAARSRPSPARQVTVWAVRACLRPGWPTRILRPPRDLCSDDGISRAPPPGMDLGPLNRVVRVSADQLVGESRERGKKSALVAAAAGMLVIIGAGGASAYGGGAVQGNECDTATGITALAAVAAATGDFNAGSECLNVDYTGAAVQSNDCDTATGINLLVGGLAPTGDANVGSKCTNIAYNGGSSWSNGNGQGF